MANGDLGGKTVLSFCYQIRKLAKMGAVLTLLLRASQSPGNFIIVRRNNPQTMRLQERGPPVTLERI